MTTRYSSSSGRLFFLAAMLLLTAAVLFAPAGQAQTATPAAPPPAGGAPAGEVQTRGKGVFALVMENIDAVFITIGVLSVAGLTFAIQGFLQNRRGAIVPPDTVQQIRDLIAQKKYRELVEFTAADDTFVSRALNPALRRAPDFEAMKEAMETSVAEQTADRFRKIEYLNIIGNLGPLLGLLGTVWGMIIAFSEMDAAGGNASPAQLAGGVSKALAHTFLGLGLAIPCLATFGVLRTIIDRRTIEASLLTEELLLSIRPADARGAGGPGGFVGSGLAGATATGRPAVGTPQPAANPPPTRKPTPPIAPSPADL